MQHFSLQFIAHKVANTHPDAPRAPIRTLRIPLQNAVGNVYCQDAEGSATTTRKYALSILSWRRLNSRLSRSYCTKNSIELIFKCAFQAPHTQRHPLFVDFTHGTWQMQGFDKKRRTESHAYIDEGISS